MLAAKVIQEQGVHVEGLNFYTGFCVEGHTHAIRENAASSRARNNALWVAEQLGIKLHIIDVSAEYKDIVINPKYGYGQNLNPCLDCKIFMVDKARAWGFSDKGFDFVITGEVIGQRPKSQRKETMPLIARESGTDDLLLRPLCAKNLPPTRPEREGWVDRAALYGFHGRNRKPQMALAESFGFSDYAQPAGGCCFLTDARYASKLQDLWDARGERDLRTRRHHAAEGGTTHPARKPLQAHRGARRRREPVSRRLSQELPALADNRVPRTVGPDRWRTATRRRVPRRAHIGSL